ncbi:MAG: hypothetical protein R3D28_01045 [Geminicoccaceae bacterium]|jgi:hypothetical protein|nr:hypothetical protein [Rhodospirillales bacterium]MCB9941986.1 hypothetical protein [Planctomycetaceae bacterium]
MAYSSSNLSAISYANGFTLWHYRTDDLIADVDNVGYFNDASKMLRTGDFVFVNAGVEDIPTHGVVVVLSNTGGVVNVSNVTQFGAIDTD